MLAPGCAQRWIEGARHRGPAHAVGAVARLDVSVSAGPALDGHHEPPGRIAASTVEVRAWVLALTDRVAAREPAEHRGVGIVRRGAVSRGAAQEPRLRGVGVCGIREPRVGGRNGELGPCSAGREDECEIERKPAHARPHPRTVHAALAFPSPSVTPRCAGDSCNVGRGAAGNDASGAFRKSGAFRCPSSDGARVYCVQRSDGGGRGERACNQRSVGVRARTPAPH